MHIIYMFGILDKIISHNGLYFKNHHVKRLCNGYNTQHSFSTLSYPKGNGQAEASNKTIFTIFKKMVNDNHKNWHDYIPYALWAYHTSIRIPIGFTSFSLVYDAKKSIPLELQIISLRVQLQDLILDEEARQARLDQLTLLDERCVNSIEHHKVYQESLKRVYKKIIKPRELKVGDLVLKENQ